jgi:hypothetical protein
VRRVHLLAVDGPPEDFAELIAAARQAGLRLGWLEAAAPAPLPPTLAAAAAAGARRAVGVGEGLAAAVKPLAGPPVLRDLVREHFLGCAAVLVRGPIAAPEPPARLAAFPGGAWRVTLAAAVHTLSTAELIARLRRPRPWD